MYVRNFTYKEVVFSFIANNLRYGISQISRGNVNSEKKKAVLNTSEVTEHYVVTLHINKIYNLDTFIPRLEERDS